MFEFEDMEYSKELDVSTNILPYIMPVEMYIDKEIAGCYSISVFQNAHGNQSMGYSGLCEMESRCMLDNVMVLAPTVMKVFIWKIGKKAIIYSTI